MSSFERMKPRRIEPGVDKGAMKYSTSGFLGLLGGGGEAQMNIACDVKGRGSGLSQKLNCLKLQS